MALLPVMVLATALQAQEEKPPPAAALPQVSSPWRTQDFTAPLERVRTELLAMATEDGLTVQEGDKEEKKEGRFRTDLVDFDSKRFGVDVSIPPPKANPKYPFFQLNAMTSGRYGLEGRVWSLSSTQVRVDLRALLEIRGMDQKVHALRWVPRFSNGEIEANYFTRLSQRLLKIANDGSSPR
jgi:hypothetical protein